MNAYEDRLQRLEEKVDLINAKLSKQTGFYAGIAATITTIWAILLGAVAIFYHR